MRTLLFLLPSLLAACAYAPQSPQKPGTTHAHLAHAKPAPMPADLDAHGFAALEAMTFDCPKAGLNAAAREAAKVPSQGTYQFSYFNLVSDAHHSLYEVHFKSNAAGEPVLRYCVSIYCQQGWDPRTTQVHVRSMSAEPARGAARADACTAAPGRKKQASSQAQSPESPAPSPAPVYSGRWLADRSLYFRMAVRRTGVFSRPRNLNRIVFEPHGDGDVSLSCLVASVRFRKAVFS